MSAEQHSLCMLEGRICFLLLSALVAAGILDHITLIFVSLGTLASICVKSPSAFLLRVRMIAFGPQPEKPG